MLHEWILPRLIVSGNVSVCEGRRTPIRPLLSADVVQVATRHTCPRSCHMSEDVRASWLGHDKSTSVIARGISLNRPPRFYPLPRRSLSPSHDHTRRRAIALREQALIRLFLTPHVTSSPTSAHHAIRKRPYVISAFEADRGG